MKIIFPSDPPAPTRAPSGGAVLRLRLSKPLARSIRLGHPWVYRDALNAPVGAPLTDGALVQVDDRDGTPLAWGIGDARSPIAVRVLALGALPVDAEGAPARLLEERTWAALQVRLQHLDLARTNAFRWIHGEADGLPGIHVDLYADAAVIRYDGAGARAFYAAAHRLPEVLVRVAARAPTLRVRVALDREDRGDHGQLEVVENGLRFGVDLGRGQKGGLFLDQRENRAAVGAVAAGRRVLNLFGYTGGFSVYAAAGGAARTDTVDLAKPAIAAARDNFVRNQLPVDNAGFHAADAFAFLADAAARHETWDIVISDPPSFAPNQRALGAARGAYRRLHRLAAAVVSPDGTLCAASCSSHFGREEFLASVLGGVQDAGRRFTLHEMRAAGFDHPVSAAFPEGDYLKFAVGVVR